MNNDQDQDRGEFAPCPLPDREQRILDGDLMNVMRQAVWDTATVVPNGDIRALKHRIHELEGELLGYKKILDEQSLREPDAVATLTEEGWTWDGDQWQRPPAAQPCPTCEALARTVMLDQTSHDTQRKPLTDKQILADETLRYYFGQNGGAGPVSKQGRKVVNAIEALHEIKEVKSCGS